MRVGLVGYGDSGRSFHVPLLRAAGAEVAVVATRDAVRSAAVRSDLPGARVVPDLDALLDLGTAAVDVVVLASPSGVHAEQAIACTAAGLAVVVDKPLAVDAPQAQRVVEAAERAGTVLTTFQNRRHSDEHRTLRRLLERGEVGRPYRFERRWERWRPVPKQRWRENATAEAGGGLLLDLGSHVVDAAVDLFGPVSAVYAELAARTTPSEDDAVLALTHASGVRSHLAVGSLVGAPGPRTRLLGTSGAYVVTDFEGEPAAFSGFTDAPRCTGWVVAGAERRPVPTAPGEPADFYRAVAAAVRAGDPAAVPVPPRETMHVAQVLDAARTSAAELRVVTLPQAPAGAGPAR